MANKAHIGGIDSHESGRSAASGAVAATAYLPSVVAWMKEEVAIYDRDWRLRYMNPAAAKTLGRPLEALIGKQLGTDIVPEIAGTPLEAMLQRVMSEGGPEEMEHYFEPWDRWGFTHAVRDGDYLLVFWQNITERKRTEKRIEESEARHRLVSDLTSDYAVSYRVGEDGQLDLEWRIGNFSGVTGYRSEEIRSLEDAPRIMHPDDLPGFRQFMQKTMAGEEGTHELRLLGPRNETRWARLRARPVLDSQGRLVRLLGAIKNITEQKEVEHELHKSEEQRRVALQAAEMGTWDYHIDLGMIFWDERTAALFGQTGRESIALDEALALIHEEDRDTVAHDIEAALSPDTDGRYDIEYRVVPPRETVRWLRAVGQTIFEEIRGTRRAVRFAGVVFDTTASRHAREALKEANKRAEDSLAQLEAVVGQMSEGLLVLDPEGNVLSMNQAALDAHDFAKPEDARRELSKYNTEFEAFDVETGEPIPVRDWAPGRVLRGETFTDLEIRVRNNRTGRTWIASCGGKSVLDSEGNMQLAIVTFRDITERWRAENELRESEARLRFTLDAARVGTWDWDLNSGRVRWSENLEEIHGLAPGSFTGTFESHLEHVHPDDRTDLEDAIRSALERGTPYHVEYRGLGSDGSINWIEGKGKVIRDANGQPTGMAGVCLNVTERKRAEQELRRSEERLEKKVRERTASLQEAVAQMEEFSYSVSHDLRAPLRAIQGYCHILLDEATGELSSDNRSYLEKAARSAERLDRLVQDILTYSRVSRMDMQPQAIALDSLVDEILHSYTSHHHPPPDIQVDRPLLPVTGHEPSLVQCLSNLIGNALKFVPPDTTPRIRIYAESIGAQTRLWIEDNGIGISSEQQERIFKVFERSPEVSEYPGTGIGLAVVKKAVERMNGSIGLSSEKGKGSRFWIQLPRP